MANREKQAEVLRKTQQQRKERKRQQVFEAVQELQRQGKAITFPAVARLARVSISYLYKWPEVKDFIQSLREQQSQQLGPLPQEREPGPGPYSLKTLHEVARKRIKELEAELQELKRQNELYRGHVAEVFELRDEVARLREALRQLTEPRSNSKVVPLPAAAPSTASDLDPSIV
jgi:transcription elongation GreA/GreB family factor